MRLIASVRFTLLAVAATAALSGCGGDDKKIEQAPITKEMEAQAEASSKHMMEQMQPKKAQPAK